MKLQAIKKTILTVFGLLMHTLKVAYAVLMFLPEMKTSFVIDFCMIYRSFLSVGFYFFLLIDLAAQDMQQVRLTIDTLASAQMHGRGYVNNGDRIAANYLYQRFEEIGLKPLGKTYLQSFEMDINTFPKHLKLKIGKQKLELGKDFIINAISKSGKGRAKFVRLDTLIYTSNEAKEKFVKKNLNHQMLWYPQAEYNQIIELPQFVINKIYEAKAVVEVKTNQLTASLSQRQLSNPFFEVSQASLDSCLANYPSKKKKIKAKFRVDAELLTNYESQNVIGYLKGTTQPDTFLVIAAHYDHLGRLGKKAYFPGANDNASGVALLLELAKFYQKPENRLPYSIAFMAFGGEEAGLLGSLHYIKNPLFSLRNIKFLLNFDLVGTGDEGITVVNGAIFEEAFKKLVEINQTYQYLPDIKRRGFAANSDHYFFTEMGVPSFFIYTLGGITAYHDIYDTAEGLPLTKFEELFALTREFILRWCILGTSKAR